MRAYHSTSSMLQKILILLKNVNPLKIQQHKFCLKQRIPHNHGMGIETWANSLEKNPQTITKHFLKREHTVTPPAVVVVYYRAMRSKQLSDINWIPALAGTWSRNRDCGSYLSVLGCESA